MGKTKKEEKPTEKDLEGFLAVLKRLGKPASSREISDALGIKDPESGRALIRHVMAKLAEEGKVVVKEAPEGTRAGKVYSVA